MPTSSFDTLSRTLATGASRRSLLRGMVGAAVGGALAGRSAVAAPQSKVGICHQDDLGQYRYQEVNGNAVPAHEAHGDAIAPDFSSDSNHCGGCGIACGDGYTCQDSACVEVTPPPVVCSNAVLAGADGADDDFFVDDDLEVFVNGASVLLDNDELSTDIGPIALGELTNGDTLRVVASNSTDPTFCDFGYSHLDAITLYCLDNGSTQAINPSDIFGQPAGGCGHVFFDQTFIVTL
jgi:hypothetical protein